MWNQYVDEKLRELERERTAQALLLMREARETKARERKPVFGPVIRAAGRTLRRAGEGLESWASPSPERERAPHWRFDEPSS